MLIESNMKTKDQNSNSLVPLAILLPHDSSIKFTCYWEMAPRQRPKVGSSRMDAALDAMRPMGFSPHLVRKCVKNLLKVYGDEGWVAIKEAAYTLLIDTLLEEPVVNQPEHDTPQNPLLENGSQSRATHLEIQPASYSLLIDTLLEEPVGKQLEHKPQNPHLEGGSQSQAPDHVKQPEPVQQPITSDKNVIVEDKKVIAEKTRGNGIIRARREEETEVHGSDINIKLMPLQDDKAQLGFDPARTLKSLDIVNSKNCACRPCFGWISDGDEDDDFLYLEPANSVDPWGTKKN